MGGNSNLWTERRTCVPRHCRPRMPPRGNIPRPPLTRGPHPLSRRTQATRPTRVTQRNLVTQRTPLTQRTPVTRRRRRRRRHRPSPTTQHTQHTPHTLSFRQLQCAPSAAESGVSLAPSRIGLGDGAHHDVSDLNGEHRRDSRFSSKAVVELDGQAVPSPDVATSVPQATVDAWLRNPTAPHC